MAQSTQLKSFGASSQMCLFLKKTNQSLKVDSQQAKQNWLNIYTYNEKKVYLNL